MPRARTKSELLTYSQENYDKLFALIDSLTPAEQVGIFPFEDRDRNIRDVLIHLYEWHQLLLTFIAENQKSEQVIPFLPAPYNWKNYGEMNLTFWEKHQKTELADAKKMLAESHQALMDLVATFSEEELFTKKYFSWTGSTSLGSYCASSMSSHYEWALKKIRQYKKALAK